MASIRLLRGRIKSAKNISQITKAMEMVAASKMKKAQAMALAGRMYAEKIYSMVMELSSRTDVTHHPLLQKNPHPTGKKLVIIISSNKGLCGGLNTNLFRYIIHTYSEEDMKKHLDIISIGKKGTVFITRIGGSLLADFSLSVPLVSSVPAICELAYEKYTKGVYDAVEIVYNDFLSALKQVPKKKTILPLTIESVESKEITKNTTQFLIEPSIREVFDALLPHYLENQIRDAVLESEASEHSARMLAMRNATDNANSLIGELTLLYNKARQEKITYEISDMVTARLAVE